MCGIVGGVAERNVLPVLIAGLKKLEYRGYDSSGAVVRSLQQPTLQRVRTVGKVEALEQKIQHHAQTISGTVGIAHTRWATHGEPAECNAHPHICNQQVAVVHNGIIENYRQLKEKQLVAGYRFTSDTDTEVVAHEIHYQRQSAPSNYQAVKQAVTQFEGAYAIGVMMADEDDELIAARKGSPLVIGIGIGEHFIASDVTALLPVTRRFIFLEDGDIAVITKAHITIYDDSGQIVTRPEKESTVTLDTIELGEHRHYMHKEIYDQPQAIYNTLQGRIRNQQIDLQSFGANAATLFKHIQAVQIIACGTSYHAGLVAKYWFEDIAAISCQVEVASEYHYRNPVIQDRTLFITLSQSGETADTLAALNKVIAKRELMRQTAPVCIPTVAICNVAESSITRACDMVCLTHAGPEIGVASTKAFSTQLAMLAILVTAIGQVQQTIDKPRIETIIKGLEKLPKLIKKVLKHEDEIEKIAERFADKKHALFLGRGTMYPIAMEGALKLKEISYIHAEAYPAGELKHGPLALIDEDMPVIAIAPHDDLLEKLKSNLQEVKARGGQLLVFEDENANIASEEAMVIFKTTTNVGRITAPVVFNITLQLLSYHVALIKGTDVDQPRNLAKSVTVE